MWVNASLPDHNQRDRQLSSPLAPPAHLIKKRRGPVSSERVDHGRNPRRFCQYDEHIR